jgi:hypothetical protein
LIGYSSGFTFARNIRALLPGQLEIADHADGTNNENR